MSLQLIIGLTLLTVVLLILGISQTFWGTQLLVNERLRKYTSVPRFLIVSTGQRTHHKFNWRTWFRNASKIFATRSYTRIIEQELIRADLPLRGEEFMLLILLTSLLPPLLFWLISANLGLALITGIAGFLGPMLWLRTAKSQRIETFNRQMGDALTVMTNSLRAGYSFLQSLDMVAREMSAPIADEFTLVIREINLGATTEEALYNLNERVPSIDLDLLVTAVIIQRQIGGNLAEIIDNISRTIRERIRIQGEIRTLTAQGRISGLIIGLLPVVVITILLMINPGYIGVLFTDPWGLKILIIGLVSELLGIFFIRQIINIKI